MAKKIAVLGDPSDHGGVLISTNQDGMKHCTGIDVCVDGCLHSCPIPGHGVTAVSAITVYTFINGKLVITTGAVAGCGAIIIPPDRGRYIE
jgi:uncharacterized Zn-binding protein involved in type VI secretion